MDILEFDYLNKDKVVANVKVYKETGVVEKVLYTKDFLDDPVPVKNPKISDVLNFFEERCFPYERYNRDELIDQLGLIDYIPFEIVIKTHGLQWDDFYWIRFKGENIKYDDIKLRD